MTKRGGEKPAKMSERWVVRFTPAQLADLLAKAEAAGIEPTAYIREAALGMKASVRNRAITMDAIRFSIIKGALADAVSINHRIEDLAQQWEWALPEDWNLAASKMRMAAEQLLEALEAL